MQTPSKEPESSSMTHEEEEEMQHDISKLRDQVQQVSLAQKVIESKVDGLKKSLEAKMDCLKKGVEAKIDGVEAKVDSVEAKMDGVEANMDGVEAKVDDLMKGMEDLKIDLKINFTKFLQEMLVDIFRVRSSEKTPKDTSHKQIIDRS